MPVRTAYSEYAWVKHTLYQAHGTELHVSGDSGILFEHKDKSAEFYQTI